MTGNGNKEMTGNGNKEMTGNGLWGEFLKRNPVLLPQDWRILSYTNW